MLSYQVLEFTFRYEQLLRKTKIIMEIRSLRSLYHVDKLLLYYL